MVIKSIKIWGFKNVTDTEPKEYKFFYSTLIKGENYVGKTSLGDALCWVFSGCNAAGISAEYILKNDKSTNMAVEAVFEDNGGIDHTLRRESLGQTHRIYIDGIPVKESELSVYIGSPQMFLAVFMIGYFQKLSSKAAKELLMGVVPFPSHEKIASKVSKDVRDYLPADDKFDANSFLKQKRAELKLVEDEIKRWQAKQSTAAEKLKSVGNIGQLSDDSELKARLDSLEKRKENLIKALAQNNTVGFLEGKLAVLRLEMHNLSNQKSMPLSQQEKVCPTCRQLVPQETLNRLQEKIEEENALKRNRLSKLREEEEELLHKLTEAREKSVESTAIQDELSAVEVELNKLKGEYEKLIIHNQAIKSEMSFLAESQTIYDTSRATLDKLSEERYKINRAITAAAEYNAIKADLQYDVMRSSLRNVSIRFQRLNQSTNELRDVFEVLYKGREYSQISTSESIRAGMEISSFINLRTGLRLPVFIDNAESITHYVRPEAQIFEAKVEKDAVLTVTEL